MGEQIRDSGEAMGSPETIHAIWLHRIQSAKEEVESSAAKGPDFTAQLETAKKHLEAVEAQYQEYLAGQSAKPEAPQTIQ